MSWIVRSQIYAKVLLLLGLEEELDQSFKDRSRTSSTQSILLGRQDVSLYCDRNSYTTESLLKQDVEPSMSKWFKSNASGGANDTIKSCFTDQTLPNFQNRLWTLSLSVRATVFGGGRGWRVNAGVHTDVMWGAMPCRARPCQAFHQSAALSPPTCPPSTNGLALSTCLSVGRPIR